jgi:prepilin peptidase CpaA
MAKPIAFGLMAAFLLVAAAADLRSGKIPNRLTYPGIVAGILYWGVTGLIHGGRHAALDGLRDASLAMLAGFGVMLLIFLAGGMGGGDVKLVALVGAWSAKVVCVLGTLIYALIAALLFAIVIMVRRGIVKRTLHRLWGAALVAAARVKPDIPADSPRVPFGLAVCIGGLIAGSEHLLGFHGFWSAF